jgi:caspase domain-containing protein
MSPFLRTTLVLALVPASLCLADAPPAPGSLRRLALVVGSNRGAADRVPLRYAVSDADRFADIVSRMGGVLPVDSVVLREPNRRTLMDALATTATRAAEARAAAQRVEVIVYFSGHADDQGLMLGREVVRYADLRQAIQGIGADVGITILDACASGAITRLKGGQARPAFLTDVGSEVQGYAFLTSSSENEAAQESERLRGSFFTYALLTGLRGAADVTGDGKVTLNEAYQFAFNETLVQTTPTQAGAQHPAYDIKMAGTGDVVMTDVRQNSASLILRDEYEGRFVVVSGKRHLVAELYKPSGRKVELGLEPGDYEVYFAEGPKLSKSSLALVDGQRQELTRGSLQPAERLPTRLRGSERTDLRMPRFGVRYTLRPDYRRDGLDTRLELVWRPSDRFTIRPRYSSGWHDSLNVDYVLGLNTDFHFRPGKTWRPYVSFGLEWHARSMPPTPQVMDLETRQPVDRPPPEVWGWEPSPYEDRTFLMAAIGIERRLSARWSFVAEIASTSPSREETMNFTSYNNGNWQFSSSGAYWEFGFGVSFNFGGRGAPKDKESKAPKTAVVPIP